MRIAEISLSISTYKGPDAMLLSLNSINRQKILPAEIIVADDGSTVDTRYALSTIVSEIKIPLHYV